MASILEKMRRILGQGESPEAVAAVAIILHSNGEEFSLLLVKRATSVSDPWSGDMALPGGKKHSSDERLKDTVLRETREETGIDLKKCFFLGTMRDVESNIKKRMLVQPFVFLCESQPEVVLNEELCSFFWIPINDLEKSRCQAKIRELEVPALKVRGEVIWGLTYRMIENLLGIIKELDRT
ncbi:CoA pyrophosphatase [Candidatus Bathyarchaeota archaeon]|nr:CoA pyrophosphatase [Candidatus Bathyarchaeota archaeon]MBS7630769.1 CoA pyrophosphatase [Candidatus Bathyarchaeota archaeon]